MTRRTFLASALAGRSPLFEGTYLQFHAGHLDWPEARWIGLFDALQQLRLHRVILQWTWNDSVSYISLLPVVFGQAARCGIRIQIGLMHSGEFWNVKPGSMTLFFSGLHRRNTIHVQDLLMWVRHPCFNGWYIPQEFDDVRWDRQTMKERGGDFLKITRQFLRKVAPRSSVSVSAFSNGVISPLTLAELWKDVLQYSRVDELLFQDGVGVKKLTITQAGEYAQAFRQKLGKKITPVIEIFEQVESDPFRAVPAPQERILQQLQVLSSAGLTRPVAFSIPEYMSPLGGEEADQLFRSVKERPAL